MAEYDIGPADNGYIGELSGGEGSPNPVRFAYDIGPVDNGYIGELSGGEGLPNPVRFVYDVSAGENFTVTTQDGTATARTVPRLVRTSD